MGKREKLEKTFLRMLEENNLQGSIIRNIYSYMTTEDLEDFLQTYYN